MKKICLSVVLFAVAAAQAFGAGSPATGDGAKYVFFFLGDGMAAPQIQAAEAYKTYLNGGSIDRSQDLLNTDNMLNLRRLPAQGLATTFADTRFITDSAAAATAFACGIKTDVGVLGMNVARDTRYKSIAELAQEQGRQIGIVSSVSLPHATPAGYYANVESRNYYNEIGYQAALSGFNFFGGGRFSSKRGDGHSSHNLNKAFEENGYTVLNSRETILGLIDAPQDRVICENPFCVGDATPYAIDRPDTNVSLAEMTKVAIACLEDSQKGFFLMVEGGKIDWACHANDAVAAIGDTLAFDDAVGEALAFARRHPQETLIVVTGDHETGGLTLGFSGKGYGSAFEVLAGQTHSFEYFNERVLRGFLKANAKNYRGAEDNMGDEIKGIIHKYFGLDYTTLSAYQQERLEKAYDRTMERAQPEYRKGKVSSIADRRKSGFIPVHVGSGDGQTGPDEVDYLTYGGYEPLTLTLTHLVNRMAGISWTSYSHSAVPVVVKAAGPEAGRFDGFYDNTDLAAKLAEAMRIRDELPVVAPAP